MDNRLTWEERGGELLLSSVRRINVLDGEVSLISELYRSLDGFWGVVGSLEACNEVLIISRRAAPQMFNSLCHPSLPGGDRGTPWGGVACFSFRCYLGCVVKMLP